MSYEPPAAPWARALSASALERLGVLQTNMRRQAALRATALRLLLASRTATTCGAQREFWLEFLCAENEYRLAVVSLMRFCRQYRGPCWRPSRALTPPALHRG